MREVAKALLALSLASSLASSVFADTLKGKTEARQLADQVMEKVGAGDTDGGLRLMRPFVVVAPSEFDVMLEQLKLQQPVMQQRFGKSIGHEFIREDDVGENLLRIVQIQRFEHHVMRWSFYFYRGNKGWVLDTFKSDDDIRQLFPL
ncbi:hypothetical protein PQR11_19890 [Paraburkholderia strydomiana]|uniref:hypothetical protein n=1 Tax=Paraburkholderia strydomiana TaxID=1245417 RepID=UPI0038BD9BDC